MIRQEVLPDGTPHYISDGHVVLTGPITGEVTLPDGTVIDVTAAAVEVESAEQALLLAEAIQTKMEN